MGVPYAEVIGDPIAHSKSPLIHKFWLEKLGLEGVYRATKVSGNELTAYFADRRQDPDWRGCNLTMPHKVQALPLADELDQDAFDAGAVNAIVPSPTGGLRGINSDVEGFRETLPAVGGDYSNYVATQVSLIGTGGAARAAMVALKGFYSEVTVFSRDQARADAFSDRYGLGAKYGFSGHISELASPVPRHDPGYPDVKPNYRVHQRYSELIINASPLGMRGFPDLLVTLDGVPSDTVVYESVYDPLETALVKAAKRNGLRVLDGLWLLIAQAAQSFRHFYGAHPPREYDYELRQLLTR
jgi:shikimate dehydrogenase